MKNLIILDRDGVINYDSDHYIKTPEEWIPIPGSLEAIAELNKQGILVVVATNQSAVGRGFLTEQTLQKIHEKMQDALKTYDGHVDAIFYCPHKPEDNCNCRKPNPGLFYQIAKKFNCSLCGVPAIGDSLRDLVAAKAAGCSPILVTSGKVIAEDLRPKDVPVFTNLLAVVRSGIKI